MIFQQVYQCAHLLCVCARARCVHHFKAGMQLFQRQQLCALYRFYFISPIERWNTLKADDVWVAVFFFISWPFKSLFKYLIKGVSAHTTSSVCVFVVVVVVFSFCYEFFPSASRVHTDLAGELCSAAHNSDPVALCVFVCLRVHVCIKWAIIAAGFVKTPPPPFPTWT